MGVVTNHYEQPVGPNPPGWTLTETAPAGDHTVARITSLGGTLHYKHATDTLTGPNAFLFEAVLSAQALPVNGERGARMWVKFADSAGPMGYNVEVRLHRNGATNQIKLFDANTGLEKASLDQDWAGSSIRVRIKRQQVGGTDSIFLQAEDAAGWDDPATPHELNDPPNSFGAPLSGFTQQPGVTPEIGFGNVVAGSYTSDWDSVHWTQCDAVTDVLPYWPDEVTPDADHAAPLDNLPGFRVHTPVSGTVTVEFNCEDNPQDNYLDNDRLTLQLGVTTGTTPADRNYGTVPTGLSTWDFTGVTDEQDVTAKGLAIDVSGRTTEGAATIHIDLTAPAPPVITDPDPTCLNHFTNDRRHPITGTAEAGTTVEVFSDTGSGAIALTPTVVADSSGDWTFTPDADYALGDHDFTATAMDASNNVSGQSAAVAVHVRTALPVGDIMISTNVGAVFDIADWSVPTPGQTMTQAFEVGVRVTADTQDYLDYDFPSNPVVVCDPAHLPPSKLMIQLPGAAGYTDYDLDETNDFAVHPIGSPVVTHWMFVFKQGGAAHRVFTEDGDLQLEAFLQDFAGNQLALPAAPPLTLDVDIPPTGDFVVQVGTNPNYVAITTPIQFHSVIPAIRSTHDDVVASSITITRANPAESVTLPLTAPVTVGNEYRYDPDDIVQSFPLGAKIDTDGDYTITATIQDGDTPPNTYVVPQGDFLVDTEAPSAECWVATGLGGTYGPIVPPYTTGPLWVALAIPLTTVDVNEATSVFNVQPSATAGPLHLDDASLNPITQSGRKLYLWPTEFTGPGTCTIDYQLWDTPLNQTLGAQQCTVTIGQPEFQISSGDLLLSHSHNDGSNTDPNNEIHNGDHHNYMGVRIHNVGSSPGDCAYRLFVVPRCLFTNVSDWLLVDENDPAPVVTGIPDGGDDESGNNRDFRQIDPDKHPNFPDDVTLFGAGAPIGSIVHTCTAGVLHSAADPLELLNAAGNPVPVNFTIFDDPTEFVNIVMSTINTYNGGGYWTAVSQNPKIANKNFNFKKIV